MNDMKTDLQEVPLSTTEEQMLTAAPINMNDIALRLSVIRKLEHNQEVIETLSKQAVEYYTERWNSLERQIDECRGYIRGFMETQGIATLPTFAGTISLKNTVEREWPEIDALIAWAKTNCPDAVKANLKEGVDKNMLLEYIARTGIEPPGFQEKVVRDLKIMKPRAPKTINGQTP